MAGGRLSLEGDADSLRQFSDVASLISEVDCLLPGNPGPNHHPKASRHAHSRSFAENVQHKWQAFSVTMQPRWQGNVDVSRQQEETVDREAGLEEHLFPDRMVAETREWLRTAAIMLPKVSWGWLPFGFTFLGFGAASKLLLFITMFAVYCSAIMYKLYEHTDSAVTLADVAQDAFGRLGRQLVKTLDASILVALPVLMHVGGMRYLQHWLFASTGVCLPWISLLFGVIVLVLAQVQRLGRAPLLNSVVVPALVLCAVGATITQLLLLKAQAAGAPPPEEGSTTYFSEYVMAVICLISANYFGQHTFLEDMNAMTHPASFPHSTATAQVFTLLMNAAIGLASFHIPHLRVTGFITLAFDSTHLLPRVINFLMFLVMTLKYVVVLNIVARRLIPWMPHLMQQVVDPSGVESDVAIKPRQLWLIATFMVVTFSYLISNTFPHTFMGLSGLLTSVAYIPMAFTLPCLMAVSLLSHNLSALEYSLLVWIIPVSIICSLMGIWASAYTLISKWHQYGDSKGCWGCNAL